MVARRTLSYQFLPQTLAPQHVHPGTAAVENSDADLKEAEETITERLDQRIGTAAVKESKRAQTAGAVQIP